MSIAQEKLITSLRAELRKVKRDLREADRMAGEAKRVSENLEDAELRRTRWTDEAKDAAGYRRGVSFDVVWAEALAALKKIGPTPEARRAAVEAK